MIKIFLVFMFLFVSSICHAGGCRDLNPNTCSILKGFTLADTNNNLHFNHRCSELDHHNNRDKRAYALFEKMDASRTYKALVLVEVSVGWMGWIQSNSKDNPEGIPSGINVDLQKLRIESLDEWGDDAFSLALQLKNTRTGETVTGNFSQTFFYSYQGSGYPTNNKYTLSKGTLNWENFIEPENEDSQTEAQAVCVSSCGESQAIRRNEYKGSNGIYIGMEKITNPEDPHTFYLIIKNEKTGDSIKLQGPAIKNLKSVQDIEYTPPQMLTIGFLNPFQEGGLWDYISDAFRYGDCIYLRKKAKKEFSSRFTN